MTPVFRTCAAITILVLALAIAPGTAAAQAQGTALASAAKAAPGATASVWKAPRKADGQPNLQGIYDFWLRRLQVTPEEPHPNDSAR